MNIYLIRHTTPDIELVYCYGQTDLDVAPSFNEEAARTKSQLPSLPDVKVYCSPLQRCRKLASYLDLAEVTYDDRLKEINFGEWEMIPWKDMDKEMYQNWVKDFVNQKAPGGESFKDLHSRVMEFFNTISGQEKNDIVLVCHGGVIRAILADILQMPLMRMFRMNIDFGGVSKVIAENGDLKVDFINR